MKKIVLIGAGGFAREIMADVGENLMCFVDDNYYQPNDDNIFPLSQFDPSKYMALVAIGDPTARKAMVEKLPADTEYCTWISDRAIILDNKISIGEGSVICAGTILTTNIKIGKHCQLNLMTTVGHDTEIGDFCTTAPNVSISGNCVIGEEVYFGTGASVREKINICDKTTFGLNAGIVSLITESGLYVGTPAKKIK